MKTGFGPRQSTGLAAVSPPYARANGIRFSGSRALQHHLSVVRLPGDDITLEAIAKAVQHGLVAQSLLYAPPQLKYLTLLMKNKY